MSRGVDDTVQDFLLAHFQPAVFLSSPLTGIILQTDSMSVTFPSQHHSGFDLIDHVVECGFGQVVLAHVGKDRKLCLEEVVHRTVLQRHVLEIRLNESIDVIHNFLVGVC